MLALLTLYEALCEWASGGVPPGLHGLPQSLVARITRSFVKDRVQFERIAAALGASSMGDLSFSRLDAFAEEIVKRYLRAEGLSAVTNTLIKVRFLHEVAVALGHAAPRRVLPEKPRRHRLTKTDENGQRVKTRENKRAQSVPYGLPLAQMPAKLQEEILTYKHFATAQIVRARRTRALRASTWNMQQDRLERFFGARQKLGHAIEHATLRDFIDPDKLESYAQFFLTITGAPTYTLKDVLSQAQTMAKHYFKDEATAQEIRGVISQVQWERQKDYDQLIQLVDPDDLYKLADHLYDHALNYENEWLNKKPCKAVREPLAMIAYHYSRALLVHLWLATWLRKDNLFSIVYGTHLYHRKDQLWFAFSREEMKTAEPHTGQVRDLWRGQKALERIEQLLARYLEFRPHLIARAQAKNPNAPPAKELFLNKDGTRYSSNGSWYVICSLSHAYLGPEKALNPHSVRHILPSHLIRKYGFSIMGEIQALLAHRSIVTTNTIYAKAQRLFSAEGAQKRIDEHRQQMEMADTVKRIEMILQKPNSHPDAHNSQELAQLKDELLRIRRLLEGKDAS